MQLHVLDNCIYNYIRNYIATCIPVDSQSPFDPLSSVLSVEDCIGSVPHHTGSIMNVAVLEIVAFCHFGITPLVLSKSLMQLMETPAMCLLVRSI